MNGRDELARSQVVDHTGGQVMRAQTTAKLEILIEHFSQRKGNRLRKMISMPTLIKSIERILSILQQTLETGHSLLRVSMHPTGYLVARSICRLHGVSLVYESKRLIECTW